MTGVVGGARYNPVTTWVTSKQPSLLWGLWTVGCCLNLELHPWLPGPTHHCLCCCVTYVSGILSLSVALGLLWAGRISSPCKYIEEPSAASCIAFNLKTKSQIPSWFNSAVTIKIHSYISPVVWPRFLFLSFNCFGIESCYFFTQST